MLYKGPISEEGWHIEEKTKEFLRTQYARLWIHRYRRLAHIAFSPADIYNASRTPIVLLRRGVR